MVPSWRCSHALCCLDLWVFVIDWRWLWSWQYDEWIVFWNAGSLRAGRGMSWRSLDWLCLERLWLLVHHWLGGCAYFHQHLQLLDINFCDFLSTLVVQGPGRAGRHPSGLEIRLRWYLRWKDAGSISILVESSCLLLEVSESHCRIYRERRTYTKSTMCLERKVAHYRLLLCRSGQLI